MNKFKCDFEMVQISDSEFDFEKKLTEEDIELNKKASRLFSKAERNAKLSYCVLCKKECSSFCNSHSVPRFALARIAENGMVSKTLEKKAHFHQKSLGLNRTGTFRLICDTCDNECFQDYENPYSYSGKITNKMIAQIALKNNLLLIYKRLVEKEFYTLLREEVPLNKDMADEKIYFGNLDLIEYCDGLIYSRKAIKKSNDKYYHLYYHRILDYVVPYAAQSAITLLGDFNDEVINNVYSESPDYKVRDIHVAVFPLETTSVVMLFVADGEKRYSKFYKQFKKLSEDDQLSAINYIVFSNIENVFIKPTVQKNMRGNKQFIDICGLTTDISTEPTDKPLQFLDCSSEKIITKAIKEFSLTKRHKIPNLLSREYAITSNNEE